MLILLFAVILVVAWIYLAWMLWKKKTNIERHYKILKAFLLVAAISFLMSSVDMILVRIAILRPPADEGAVSGYIALFSVLVFIIATVGGLVVFIKGRRKTTSAGERMDSPLELLKNRYARGEIDKEEYEEKKKDLI